MGSSYRLGLWIFIAASVAQLAMIFVMFFVQFRMFTIIPLFLIPMLIMQILSLGLLLAISRKWYFRFHYVFSQNQLFKSQADMAGSFHPNGSYRIALTNLLHRG
jgi:hypothetical protein